MCSSNTVHHNFIIELTQNLKLFYITQFGKTKSPNFETNVYSFLLNFKLAFSKLYYLNVVIKFKKDNVMDNFSNLNLD